MKKKPDRKWIAILVLMTGMAWAAGASSHYPNLILIEKHKTLG